MCTLVFGVCPPGGPPSIFLGRLPLGTTNVFSHPHAILVVHPGALSLAADLLAQLVLHIHHTFAPYTSHQYRGFMKHKLAKERKLRDATQLRECVPEIIVNVKNTSFM